LKIFLFATGVNNSGGAPLAANISEIFEKFNTALKGYSGACEKQ
jgi:hypothetical protein